MDDDGENLFSLQIRVDRELVYAGVHAKAQDQQE